MCTKIIEEGEWRSEDNFWPATSSYSIPGVTVDFAPQVSRRNWLSSQSHRWLYGFRLHAEAKMNPVAQCRCLSRENSHWEMNCRDKDTQPEWLAHVLILSVSLIPKKSACYCARCQSESP